MFRPLIALLPGSGFLPDEYSRPMILVLRFRGNGSGGSSSALGQRQFRLPASLLDASPVTQVVVGFGTDVECAVSARGQLQAE